MPVVPIAHTLVTDKGAIVFKPRVMGLSVKELHARYGDRLPPEMVDSLKEIYGFSQALFERSKISSLHPSIPIGGRTRSMYIDLNPSNFVWVEDRQELAKFGLTKPGFMLYELGEYVKPKYRESTTSFPAFIEEFTGVMRAEGAAAAPHKESMLELEPALLLRQAA